MKLLSGRVISSGPVEQVNPTKAEISVKLIEEIEQSSGFLDWEFPAWNDGGFVHNWHNYAPQQLIDEWVNFTDFQKKLLAFTLDQCAGKEHWD